MAETNHIGRNLRQIRLLKGMKQETFAQHLGIAQQNVSKMEKKKNISQDKLEAAAKVLGVSVDAIEKFNEKAVFNNNIALEQGSGQTNHIYPVKELIDYFKDELSKKDKRIEELEQELMQYRSSNKDSSQPKSLHKIDGLAGKQAAQ